MAFSRNERPCGEDSGIRWENMIYSYTEGMSLKGHNATYSNLHKESLSILSSQMPVKEQ